MPRNVSLQILRGPLSNIPLLGDGEFYFATDQAQLYVGLSGSSLPIGAPMGIVIQDPVTPSQQARVTSSGDLGVASQSSNGVSIGSTVNKTVVMKTGSLVTTAVTANQSILAYTVTAGKNLFIEYIDISGRLTAPSATASVLGTAIIQMAAVTVYASGFVNPTTSDAGSQTVRITFPEPVPLAAGLVLGFLVTPAAATSMTWTANFAGYEK
jgi:hypothetical protein